MPGVRHHPLSPARAALLTAVGLLVLSGCSNGTVGQLGYRDGAAPNDGNLSTLETIGVFVVAPLALLLLVAALVWLPGVVRGNRYRPGRGWGATPLWFGGPPDPAAAVESAEVGDVVRGGASGSW